MSEAPELSVTCNSTVACSVGFTKLRLRPIVRLMPVAFVLIGTKVLNVEFVLRPAPVAVVPLLAGSAALLTVAYSQFPLTGSSPLAVGFLYTTETWTPIAAPVLFRLRIWDQLHPTLPIWIVPPTPRVGLTTIEWCAFAQIGADNSSAVATTKRTAFLRELYAASMICLGSSMITDHKLCLPIN